MKVTLLDLVYLKKYYVDGKCKDKYDEVREKYGLKEEKVGAILENIKNGNWRWSK